MIVVVVSMSGEDGSVVSGPDIITRGFVYVKESEGLMEELRKVDMSFIKPGQSVNILASHHGFHPAGRPALRHPDQATRDAIIEKTGCRDVRLRAGVGMRFRETEEYIRRYQLDEYFGPGKTKGVALLMRASLSRRRWVPSTVSRLSTTRLDCPLPPHRCAGGPLPPAGGQSGQALRHVLCPHRDPLHLPSEPGPPGRQLHRPGHL